VELIEVSSAAGDASVFERIESERALTRVQSKSETDAGAQNVVMGTPAWQSGHLAAT
jgi:hypothetical protein